MVRSSSRSSTTCVREQVATLPMCVCVPHGASPAAWQCCASSSLEHHFRETVVVAQSSAANQAHLRSHSGPGGSAGLCGAPSSSVCDCHCRSQSPTASVGRVSTSWTATGELAPGQGGCAREDFGPNLSRGGGCGANQRDVEGHEHHCVGS